MAKWPESNGKGTERCGLPATVSSFHPVDFPLGSVESRAAARAMIRPGELRAGDKGKTEDGGLVYCDQRKPGGSGEPPVTGAYVSAESDEPDAANRGKDLRQ